MSSRVLSGWARGGCRLTFSKTHGSVLHEDCLGVGQGQRLLSACLVLLQGLLPVTYLGQQTLSGYIPTYHAL